jgi:acetoin utilization deacetylase AcuC-like enzyme
MAALSADPICREHLAGRAHPERPERFDAMLDALRRAGSFDTMRLLDTRTATEEEMLLWQTPVYVRKMMVSVSVRGCTWSFTEISEECK